MRPIFEKIKIYKTHFRISKKTKERTKEETKTKLERYEIRNEVKARSKFKVACQIDASSAGSDEEEIGDRR